MKFLKRGNKPVFNNLDLETRLQEVYQKVTPRPEFVRKLRYQLVRDLAPTQTQARQEKRKLLFAAGASLVGAILALFMGVRTFLTLAAALGLLLEMKREATTQKPLPVRQIK